jgi:DNA-binding MarR family transcriptional regulator
MTDEVDEIVAAWRRERPDLDVAPLEVLSRVSRLAAVLDERRAAAFGEHDLQPHEFDVLAALRRSGEPFELTAGQLCALTHVTSGTMTSRLDNLTLRNFVFRLADPTDGRLVRVRLTPTGRQRIDATFAALLDSERALLGRLADPKRDALVDALRDLLRAATVAAATRAETPHSYAVSPD